MLVVLSILIITATIIVITVPRFSLKPFDYRGLKWGATQEEIIAIQGEPDNTYFNNQVLQYTTYFLHFTDVEIVYSLDESGLLYQISVFGFGNIGTTKQADDLVNLYKQKYGDPQIGIEVSQDRITDTYTWTLRDTQIKLSVDTVNSRFAGSFNVLYVDRNFLNEKFESESNLI